MLLTPKISEDLTKCGIDEIEFSLDGNSSELNQLIRKGSNTDKVIFNINRLINLLKSKSLKKPKISIATTQFLNKIPESGIISSSPVPEWLKNNFNINDVEFKSTYAVEWPHMGIAEDFERIHLKSFYEEKNVCDHIINTITIRSDGNVVPCCYDLTSKLVMGNVYENDLLEIWNNVKYLELRKSIKTKQYMSICDNCAVVKNVKYLKFKNSL